MTSTTPRSGMPLLAAAQAQKHVTHNEALLQLDALGCARILDRDLNAPPGSPSDGDTYLIHATATGDWTGQDGRIAYALDGGWRFYAPFAGLMAYVVDEAKPIVFDGSAWNDFVSLLSLENIPMLGVNATADATNKLAVKSSALLFDNIGNGVQAKLNKHASGDTASILYQTAYSGRAEFGLTGDDDFHCKVSPDGSAWTDAVVIDKTSGALTLAAGVQLPNGSASSPAAAVNTNSGMFWDAANSGLGFSAGGTEIAYLSATDGLAMFGANPVIDQNRAHRLRSMTIAGSVAPTVAGNLFYHSDAQGGLGEVAVDTGVSWRYAGQPAVKKLTTDANATYTPRVDGRIVRDSAALTVARKLTLKNTNVTDGHEVEVSRRGSSGGKTRDVYQTDGTTLIVSLADNTSADFVYDGVAAAWFQK
jgi:hypothetical protein